MTQAKLTPGPWTVRVIGVGGGWDDPVNVCEVRGASDKHVAEHIFEADAHLIAAAPDLLEASQEIAAAWLELAHALPQDDRIEALEWGAMQRLRAAIAKAEGQS